jgi:hypothetical protein
VARRVCRWSMGRLGISLLAGRGRGRTTGLLLGALVAGRVGPPGAVVLLILLSAGGLTQAGRLVCLLGLLLRLTRWLAGRIGLLLRLSRRLAGRIGFFLCLTRRLVCLAWRLLVLAWRLLVLAWRLLVLAWRLLVLAGWLVGLGGRRRCLPGWLLLLPRRLLRLAGLTIRRAVARRCRVSRSTTGGRCGGTVSGVGRDQGRWGTRRRCFLG